ncbi:MAG: hypothetical protein ACOCXX_00520 [Planctomycetota bacterium]
MTEQDTSSKRSFPRRVLGIFIDGPRRIVFWSLVLLLLIASPFIIAWMVVPVVVRGQAAAATAESWEGDLSIGDIEFSWTGPSTFREVSLTDTRGRRWLSIDSITIRLADFPGFAPKLSTVDVGDVVVNAQLTDGKLEIPIKVSEEDDQPTDIGKMLALERIRVESITVNAVDGDNTTEVFKSDGPLVMEGTPEKLVLDTYNARLAEGRLATRLTLHNKPDEPLRHEGRLELRTVFLGKMLRDLGTGVDMKNARLDLLTTFEGGKLSPQETRAKGNVHLKDAHMGSVPILSKVMGFFKLTDPANFEANAEYRTDGYLITLDDGRMANNLSAFKVEPGGTVDLDKRTVDLYVVGAMFSKVEGFLSDIPVANILADATKKLAENTTRVHVKGHFDDPPSQLLTKQPLKDLAEGTVGFFKTAVEGGGKLGNDILKQGGRLID